MLSTLDLINILHHYPDFGGVFPINLLPIHFEKPKFFIINLDPHYQTGSHWVALKFDINGYAYYYDSFGRPPYGNILTFIERHAKYGYSFNKKKIQGNDSIACGLFCLKFILLGNDNHLFTKCNHIVEEQEMLQKLRSVMPKGKTTNFII